MKKTLKDWESYSIYILESLKRLETKFDDVDSNLREHMEQEERRFSLLEKQINRAESDLRWHSKIAASIGGMLALMISWAVDSFRR